MSKLYNDLKYNVDKINSLYKKGFVFNSDTTWTAPYNGEVHIEGRTEGLPAKDYAKAPAYIFHSFKVTESDFISKIKELYDGFSTQVVGGNANVSCDKSYEIQFKDNTHIFYFDELSFFCNKYDNVDIKLTSINGGSSLDGLPVGKYHITCEGPVYQSNIGECNVSINHGIVGVSFEILEILRQPSQSPKLTRYLKLSYVDDVLKIFPSISNQS